MKRLSIKIIVIALGVMVAAFISHHFCLFQNGVVKKFDEGT